MVSPTQKIQRILVRGTNWVGDTVMSIPAIKEIRKTFPDAEIVFWARNELSPLIDLIGFSNRTLTFDHTKTNAVFRVIRMTPQIKRLHFDMAILLQNAFESALTTFLSRVPLRCGYETDLRGPLLNIKVPFRQNYKSEHQVFYYLQIIRHLGLALNKSSCESQDPDCSIEIPKKIEKEGNRILASMGIGADDPFFCLCPGSVNSEAKRWPAEYFAKLADIISEEMHAKTVFVGSPSEKSFINSIVDKMKYNSGINIAGSSNLAQSMSIMSKSRFVVSNDTGSAHIAVAAGAKILTIFGPTIAGATAPYGPDAHIISGEAPCTPCRHYTCPVPGHPCMSRIDPESVMARVLELI